MTNKTYNTIIPRLQGYLPKLLLIDTILLVARIAWVVFYDTDLFSEEAQYWLWSKNLDISYYSKPPLIAYANYLSASVLGNTELGVRINAIVIGFILPVLVYNFAHLLFKDHGMAFTSAIILMAMPFYHSISLFFTTDTLVTLFWLLAQFYFYKACRTNDLKHWLLLGSFAGLAVLSKYTAILFYPLIILYGIFFKKELFRLKGFYLAIVISIALCIPELVWNFDNSWVSLKHVAFLSGVNKEHFLLKKTFSNICEYLGGQILVLSPFLLIPAVYLIVKKGRKKIFMQHVNEIIYLFFPLPFIWIFFCFVACNKIEINWLIFAYPTVPILLGYVYYKHLQHRKLKLYAGITLVFMIFITVPKLFDFVGLSKIYPARVDTLYRMYGWKDLGIYVSQMAGDNNAPKTFIFSDTYHIASELAFYVDKNPQTYCINTGRRMNQFDLWPGLEQFEGKRYDAVYVSKNEAPPELLASFEKVENYSRFISHYRDTCPLEFHIYRLKGFKSFNNKEINTF